MKQMAKSSGKGGGKGHVQNRMGRIREKDSHGDESKAKDKD